MVQGPGGIPDGFNLSGGKFFKKLEVCPGTIYWILVKIDNFIGDTHFDELCDHHTLNSLKGSPREFLDMTFLNCTCWVV